MTKKGGISVATRLILSCDTAAPPFLGMTAASLPYPGADREGEEAPRPLMEQYDPPFGNAGVGHEATEIDARRQSRAGIILAIPDDLLGSGRQSPLQ